MLRRQEGVSINKISLKKLQISLQSKKMCLKVKKNCPLKQTDLSKKQKDCSEKQKKIVKKSKIRGARKDFPNHLKRFVRNTKQPSELQ